MSEKPSEEFDKFWLMAENKIGEHRRLDVVNSGKWLLFISIDKIDEVWDKVKTATEEGRLGFGSKVSTARPNPNASNPNTKVICVYTYDWEDEDDVVRVREELRDIGIIQKIPYKADVDTLAGRYSIKGDKRISKYYE